MAEKKKKNRFWSSKRKTHIADARNLIAEDVAAAVGHLDAALALSPQHEKALELKARALLFLRKFKDVADLLRDYIPSYMSGREEEEDSSTSTGSGNSSSAGSFSRERVNLLVPPAGGEGGRRLWWCFSVSDLKNKVLAGLRKRNGRKGTGACYHLGMMEDAMVLLQTGRRLAAAASRRDSHGLHDDDFPDRLTTSGTTPFATPPSSELDSVASLLTHIKLLLRRRAAAVAALDASHPAESIRHFSKILDSRRSVPSTFAALCFLGRGAAHRSAGRVADAIADCNRALALDPASIPAMRARADLLDSVHSLPDCLRDLDHLKLLYDATLQDRKLPGPAWRPHHDVRFRDIPAELRRLTGRIQEMRRRVGKGEGWSVDCYGLLGVRRGCTRSELERTHLLLSLKHRPDRAAAFVDRLEFADEHRDVDTVRDEARMSALILYRLLQKGFTGVMSDVVESELLEKERIMQQQMLQKEEEEQQKKKTVVAAPSRKTGFQGVFCRDMAVVGGLLSSPSGFNASIPVKLEALSC